MKNARRVIHIRADKLERRTGNYRVWATVRTTVWATVRPLRTFPKAPLPLQSTIVHCRKRTGHIEQSAIWSFHTPGLLSVPLCLVISVYPFPCPLRTHSARVSLAGLVPLKSETRPTLIGPTDTLVERSKERVWHQIMCVPLKRYL